jgi:hypothetical protein
MERAAIVIACSLYIAKKWTVLAVRIAGETRLPV